MMKKKKPVTVEVVWDPDIIDISTPWHSSKFEIYDCDGMKIGVVKHHPGADHVRFRIKEKRMTLREWERLDSQMRQLFATHFNTGGSKK